MHKVLNILAKTICVLLHPMLMPCYGMALFFLSNQPTIALLPKVYCMVSMVGTFVLTLVIPFVLMLFLWRKGYIDSLHIEQAQQRTTPYIYTLICYGFWTYFLHSTIHMPSFIVCICRFALPTRMLSWHGKSEGLPKSMDARSSCTRKNESLMKICRKMI